MSKTNLNLKLITAIPKYKYYYNAFNNTLINKRKLLLDKDIKTIKQAVLYGTKYISMHRCDNKTMKTKETVENHFRIIETVKYLLMQMSPNDFINLFPIKKVFDGAKYECKDYFYTIDKMKNYDITKPLRSKLDDFLWDYTNDLIGDYVVEMLSTASKLCQLQGQKSIIEQFAEQKGIELQTYTINEDAGYIMDNTTHKTMPYVKPIPDYIRVAK